MYAVIKTGGKQYRVAKGDVLKVEKLAGEEGKKVVFDEVLALGDTIGTPLVAGAVVKGEILKQARDAKIIVFKKKRRQNYRRKNGHRQYITLVKITDLGLKGETKAAPATSAKPQAEAPAAKAKTETKAKATTKKAKEN